MAESALAAFLGAGGRRVAYVGEWGGGGDTATPGFERALLASCELAGAEVPLPNWGEARASLTVWRRRRRREEGAAAPAPAPATAPAALGPPRSPVACGVCSRVGVALWRCRLTGVLRCGDACAAAGARVQSDEAALRLALVPPPPLPLPLPAGAATATGGGAGAQQRRGQAAGPLAPWGAPAFWAPLRG